MTIDRVLCLAIVALSAGSSAAVYAEEEYQTEISADYLRADTSQDFRSTMISASAKVFLEPVKTAEHPYSEAAFLERIGSVSVTAYDIGMKAGIIKGDGRLFAAGVNYAKPDFPLAIQVGYFNSKIDFDTPFGSPATSKSNGYSIGIGNYFTNSLLAGLDYENTRYESSGTPVLLKHKNLGLFAHYVDEMEHGNALSLDGRLYRSTYDDGIENLKNTIEHFTADYFFSRGLSAGFGIENNTGADLVNEGRTYSANIRSFISSDLSVNAMYSRSLSAHAGYPDEKFFNIGMALRF